jgi:hypothetical protein
VTAAYRGKFVVLRSPVVFRNPPGRFNPISLFHPVQRRIERAFFNLKHVIRDLPDPPRDRVPMHWPPGQRLQDHEVQWSMDEIGGVHAFFPFQL